MNAAGYAKWYDWTSAKPMEKIDGFQGNASTSLLLDLDDGTLSLYQNGRRLATLKDGLSGAYCWYASVWKSGDSLTIKRDLAPDE